MNRDDFLEYANRCIKVLKEIRRSFNNVGDVIWREQVKDRQVIDMDKVVDVSDRYSAEILNIKNKLNQLEKGRVYEITGVKMDGYLFTNIEQLRESINDLLYKIEFNKESINERVSREFRKFNG